MATKWTDAQKLAIGTRNKTLLLSAAAGSGKTTTLTERIIRSITDKDAPADISNMLIVTFTRASATDLKTKIFNAVSDALANDPTNRHLTQQLIKLGSANISTIDSFYLNAVRQNFSALGLSSSFRIADSSETDLLAVSVMTDVTEDFYTNNESFPAFCECFESIRDTEGVIEPILLKLYDDCMHTPEGVEYLAKCASQARESADIDFLDTNYGKIIRHYACIMFTSFTNAYDELISRICSDEPVCKAYYNTLDGDRTLCVDMLLSFEGKEATADYGNIAEKLNSYTFSRMPSRPKEGSEELIEYSQKLRDALKSGFNGLKSTYFCYSVSDLKTFFIRTADNLELLYSVLSDFEARYSEEKKRRNILELTDVKRYALKLFANDDGTPTELAKSVAESYSDIYIDEYQDVDPVQDLIFRCISTSYNRFMVGDIKQSIYSFRGAEPQLFSSYRSHFPVHGSSEAEESDCETIFMSENFRCAKPIIDFTNLVCSNVFSMCHDSIGYTREDDLVYAKIPPDGAPEAPTVTVRLFGKNTKSAVSESGEPLISPTDAEARYIAKEIYELIQNGKKQNGERIAPGDIAVLYRNKTAAAAIVSALDELGIKTNATESTQYFQNPDVLMTLCILNAVDNPQRDVYLAGAMRSPIYGFSLEDILQINNNGTSSDSLYDKLCAVAETDTELGVRCRVFNDTLQRLRTLSTSLPIDKFLKHLFASDAFVASGLVSDRSASGEGGNLKRLYEYARTFEAGSFKGLYSFIEFINTVIENGKTLEAQVEASSPDRVTLSTIHRSKGLEFPVCFVCNAAASMKTGNRNNDISFAYGIGVAMDLSDSTGFAHYASPLKKLLELDSSMKGIEEEMRVLYVALTRAKERLYVTGHSAQRFINSYLSNADFCSVFNNRYSVICAGSYMDWILTALKLPNDTACYDFAFYTTDALPDYTAQISVNTDENEDMELNQALFEKLRADFAFKYPYGALGKIPAKLSVSRLSPDVLDESDTSADLFNTLPRTAVPDFFLPSKKKSTSAERGTATHLFLQFCNFENAAKYGVKHALDELTLKRFIPEAMAELVYTEDLEKLMQSELMSEILSAKRIIREQRFNILLPTSEFTQDPLFREQISNERIAVQGVIDLLIIDKEGRICLYDYKTDRLTREELADPLLAARRMNATHGLQLSYYAKAVTLMFGKAPDRIAVYSTCAARLFDIDTKELLIPHDIL